jgi:hypothetical protein
MPLVIVILLNFGPVLGATTASTGGSLSAYTGSYVSHESNHTYRLDVALMSGQLLFVSREPSAHFAQCWIAHQHGKGLIAINGVASDYRKYSPGPFPTDFYGDLSIEPSGILDVEHNPGQPAGVTHWKRISRTPDGAIVDRVCGNGAQSATQ